MFSKIKNKNIGKHLIKVGMGPFPNYTLKSIYNYTCSKCNRPMPESTIFWNGLVVSKGLIILLCSQCRTGKSHRLYKDHPFVANGEVAGCDRTIDILIILKEINDLITEARFNWFEILLCLRGGVGGFQTHSGRENYDGFSKYRIKTSLSRYVKLLPGSCSECGALWANEWEIKNKKITLDDLCEQRGWSFNSCWACNFPHSNQWFMYENPDKVKNSLK